MIARLILTLRNLLKYGGAWMDGADWSKEDAMRFKGFLLTETGQKLSAKLRNACLSMNAAAVQSGEAHRCGYAAGYQAALADMQTFSEQGSPEEAQNSEEEADTGGAGLEHLSP